MGREGGRSSDMCEFYSCVGLFSVTVETRRLHSNLCRGTMIVITTFSPSRPGKLFFACFGNTKEARRRVRNQTLEEQSATFLFVIWNILLVPWMALAPLLAMAFDAPPTFSVYLGSGPCGPIHYRSALFGCSEKNTI